MVIEIISTDNKDMKRWKLFSILNIQKLKNIEINFINFEESILLIIKVRRGITRI